MRTFLFASILVGSVLPASADGVRDNYTHSTAVAITLTSPSRVTHQDTSQGTLQAGQRGADIWFKWTEDGYVCRLSGKVKGHTIRFNAGQSCTIEDDDSDSSFKLSLTAGSGTVDDDGELDLQIQWKIRGTVQGTAVSGTANQRTSAVPH